MAAKARTIILTSLSALVGGLIDYQFNIPLAPALFGIAVLAANHSQIRLRNKAVAYFLIGLLAMFIFLFMGLFMNWVGLLITGHQAEGLSIYIGSGLCALTVALVFSQILKNLNLDPLKSLILFLLGGLSLLAFFLVMGLPLNNLYRGIQVDEKFYMLFFTWQLLVGIGIGISIKNENQHLTTE